MTVLLALLTAVVVVLTVLVFGLLRAYATVLQRLHALEGGTDVHGGRTFALLPMASNDPEHSPEHISVAPLADEEFPAAHDITGATPAGEIAVVPTVAVGHDTVLLFLSSGCSTCATFWAELAAPIGLPAHTRLLVVTQDPDVDSVVSVRALAPPRVDVVMSSRAWSDYGVPGSPYVIAVDGSSGRVRGEGTGQSWAQIAELLARSTGDAAYLTGGPQAGKPAGDSAREADVDRELIEAGLLPGDPRLYGGNR